MTLKKIRTRKGIVKYVPVEDLIIHPANFRKFEFLKRYGILPRKGVDQALEEGKEKGRQGGKLQRGRLVCSNSQSTQRAWLF